MTAFISHSSKDKAFVRQVVDELGPLAVKYDEDTFEFTLNVQAIRQALKRSSVAAFFVSQHSISSTFVTEEQRQALEALGRGSIKRVIIFTIDQTSYRELPEWMREINFVQRASNPKSCARKIQSMLVEIDAQDSLALVYVGREKEELTLRKALAVPKDRVPVAIHVSGFHGVGRRTFLRKSLARVMPRYYDTFVEITTSRYQGVEDLYRSLYQLQVVSSMKDTLQKFQDFSTKSLVQQAEGAADLIKDLVSDGSLLIVVDEFGVFDEEGDYQHYWKVIIEKISDMDRPVIGFVQSRIQPYKFKSIYGRSFHIRMAELEGEDSRDLIALSLHEDNIDFTDSQLKQIADLVDGHPFNLRFAVGYARHYGLEN